MARTKTYTLTGLNVSATGIAAAQLPTAATPLTLQAAAAALSPARFITLTSAANISAINFTIVGLDRWGNLTTETIAGPNANTVQYKTAFSVVTSITPSASDGANNVSAGWPVGAVTPWVLCGRGFGNDAVPEALVSVLSAVGTVDANIEITYDEFPRLAEKDITVDQSVLAAAFTPGTPQAAKGQGVRVVLTTGAGNTAIIKFTRPGPY